MERRKRKNKIFKSKRPYQKPAIHKAKIDREPSYVVPSSLLSSVDGGNSGCVA